MSLYYLNLNTNNAQTLENLDDGKPTGGAFQQAKDQSKAKSGTTRYYLQPEDSNFKKISEAVVANQAAFAFLKPQDIQWIQKNSTTTPAPSADPVKKEAEEPSLSGPVAFIGRLGLGMAGGIGGEALGMYVGGVAGAALCSVVPVVGTMAGAAVGSLIGGAIGAGLGSVAGELVAQRFIDGKDSFETLDKGALVSSFVIGSVTAGFGGSAVKGIQGLAKGGVVKMKKYALTHSGASASMIGLTADAARLVNTPGFQAASRVFDTTFEFNTYLKTLPQRMALNVALGRGGDALTRQVNGDSMEGLFSLDRLGMDIFMGEGLGVATKGLMTAHALNISGQPYTSFQNGNSMPRAEKWIVKRAYQNRVAEDVATLTSAMHTVTPDELQAVGVNLVALEGNVRKVKAGGLTSEIPPSVIQLRANYDGLVLANKAAKEIGDARETYYAFESTLASLSQRRREAMALVSRSEKMGASAPSSALALVANIDAATRQVFENWGEVIQSTVMDKAGAPESPAHLSNLAYAKSELGTYKKALSPHLKNMESPPSMGHQVLAGEIADKIQENCTRLDDIVKRAEELVVKNGNVSITEAHAYLVSLEDALQARNALGLENPAWLVEAVELGTISDKLQAQVLDERGEVIPDAAQKQYDNLWDLRDKYEQAGEPVPPWLEKAVNQMGSGQDEVTAVMPGLDDMDDITQVSEPPPKLDGTLAQGNLGSPLPAKLQQTTELYRKAVIQPNGDVKLAAVRNLEPLLIILRKNYTALDIPEPSWLTSALMALERVEVSVHTAHSASLPPREASPSGSLSQSPSHTDSTPNDGQTINPQAERQAELRKRFLTSQGLPKQEVTPLSIVEQASEHFVATKNLFTRNPMNRQAEGIASDISDLATQIGSFHQEMQAAQSHEAKILGVIKSSRESGTIDPKDLASLKTLQAQKRVIAQKHTSALALMDTFEVELLEIMDTAAEMNIPLPTSVAKAWLDLQVEKILLLNYVSVRGTPSSPVLARFAMKQGLADITEAYSRYGTLPPAELTALAGLSTPGVANDLIRETPQLTAFLYDPTTSVPAELRRKAVNDLIGTVQDHIDAADKVGTPVDSNLRKALLDLQAEILVRDLPPFDGTASPVLVAAHQGLADLQISYGSYGLEIPPIIRAALQFKYEAALNKSRYFLETHAKEGTLTSQVANLAKTELETLREEYAVLGISNDKAWNAAHTPLLQPKAPPSTTDAGLEVGSFPAFPTYPLRPFDPIDAPPRTQAQETTIALNIEHAKLAMAQLKSEIDSLPSLSKEEVTSLEQRCEPNRLLDGATHLALTQAEAEDLRQHQEIVLAEIDRKRAIGVTHETAENEVYFIQEGLEEEVQFVSTSGTWGEVVTLAQELDTDLNLLQETALEASTVINEVDPSRAEALLTDTIAAQDQMRSQVNEALSRSANQQGATIVADIQLRLLEEAPTSLYYMELLEELEARFQVLINEALTIPDAQAQANVTRLLTEQRDACSKQIEGFWETSYELDRIEEVLSGITDGSSRGLLEELAEILEHQINQLPNESGLASQLEQALEEVQLHISIIDTTRANRDKTLALAESPNNGKDSPAELRKAADMLVADTRFLGEPIDDNILQAANILNERAQQQAQQQAQQHRAEAARLSEEFQDPKNLTKWKYTANEITAIASRARQTAAVLGPLTSAEQAHLTILDAWAEEVAPWPVYDAVEHRDGVSDGVHDGVPSAPPIPTLDRYEMRRNEQYRVAYMDPNSAAIKAEITVDDDTD